MGSRTGHIFHVSTFGESHGGALGAVVDGCPPGIELDLDGMERDLARRRPGQSSLTSQRKEPDTVEVLSGLFEGRTLGTPIALLIRNRDADPSAYEPFKDLYRPSHADFTTEMRYGIRNWQGGGRASARETVARVAAGAIARQVLREFSNVEIVAWVEQVGAIEGGCDPETVSLEAVDANPVRCPNAEAAIEMEELIREVRSDGDTIGGVVRCVARNVPAGLGDPVFDKLEADLAKSLMSLPAAKGFESGLGFSSVGMRGSEHNDPFFNDNGRIRTRTNHSGGIQGGISNGMPVMVSVAFKPVATLFKPQETVNQSGESAVIKPRGRHDPCVLPRAVPMVEAAVALVLCDHLLRTRALRGDDFLRE
jgi:chorismate synthase